jgi:outer membrane protein assembly factor BamD
MKSSIKLLIVLIFILLGSCKNWFSHSDDDDNPYAGMSAKELYSEGTKALKKKQYTESIKKLEALDTMYPFNDYAEQAELNLIYAYYSKEDFPSAAATAERYIHLYPRSKNADYAYYMKGMANFNQSRGALASYLPMDLSWRDPGTQSQSYSDFASLVQKFPNSRYKAISAQHMIYLRNMFAQRELNTALYYYERQMYVAALERANYLIRTYPQSEGTQKALEVVYYSNKNLNLNKAADDTLQVYMKTYHRDPKQIRETI